MSSTERTKVRRVTVPPDACAVLDFTRGPAPSLGLYVIYFVEAGVVGVEPVASLEEAAARAVAMEIAQLELPPALALLEEFAAGEPVDVATVPAVIEGPPFFVKVWDALRRVGRGDVCTYAHLGRAVRAPRAMRAVGQAMAQNPLPLVVPCHRVIADHARLGGYTGGTDRKRALLALEGVDVDGDVVRPGQLALKV